MLSFVCSFVRLWHLAAVAYVTYLLTILNDKSSHSTYILCRAHSRVLLPPHSNSLPSLNLILHALKSSNACLFYFILQFPSLFKLTKTFSGRQSVKENIFNSPTIIWWAYSSTHLQPNEIKLSLRESNFFHKLFSRIHEAMQYVCIHIHQMSDAYCMRLSNWSSLSFCFKKPFYHVLTHTDSCLATSRKEWNFTSQQKYSNTFSHATPQSLHSPSRSDHLIFFLGSMSLFCCVMFYIVFCFILFCSYHFCIGASRFILVCECDWVSAWTLCLSLFSLFSPVRF